MSDYRFDYHPSLAPPRHEDCHSVYFWQEKLLLPVNAFDPWIKIPGDYPESLSLGLGHLNDLHLRCVELSECPEGWRALTLREYLLHSSEMQFRVVSSASQLLYWARSQNFCCRCGKPLEFVGNDRALVCQYCQHRVYPVVNPCVIVTIYRPGEILLARSLRMKKTGIYSCVAGFVEVGETLEQAVQREVREETGIEVGAMRYVGSQPWPFPHQLMLGFIAEYQGGELVIDADEIDHADWFRPDALPLLPPQQTIAAQLIQAGLDACRL